MIADSVIALSYLALLGALFHGVRRERDPLPTSLLVLAILFVAGALSHGTAIAIRAWWSPGSEVPAGLRIVQAVAALGTVALLVYLLSSRRDPPVAGLGRLNRELAAREAQLAEAQEIAGLGSWEWDIVADRIEWSRELYRIFGLEPDSPVGYATAMERILAEDREAVAERVQEAIDTTGTFQARYRTEGSDGVVRTLVSKGRVYADESGRPTRMIGIAQDVTESIRIEEALRASEEEYRRLAEHVREMIIRFTPSGRVTYASPATRSILGYEPQSAVGRAGQEFLHPEDLARVVEAHRSLLDGVEPPPVLCRLMHRDGHPVWVETTTRGVFGADGRLDAIVAVARDVTESVEAARDARLLQEVAMAANRSENEQEAMRKALRLVSAHTGWPVGHVYVPEPDRPGELGPADIWHVEDRAALERVLGLPEGTAPAPGQGLPARVLRSGRVEWIRDIQTDPAPDGAELARDLGLRAAVAFPLRQGDSTIAVMEFFSDRAEEPDGAMVDLMDGVGTQLGAVLRRRQAERELRASEERFRALAESANDAIVTIDEWGHIVYCNESLERIFGYPCHEVIGTEASRFLSRSGTAAGEPSAFLTVDGAGLSGTTVELVGRRSDGTEFPVELSLARWESERGSFLTGILRDITARKRVEKALEEKVEELARSNAELGLFTYIASHDLREPLRTVGSNIQLFERHLAEHIDSEARKQIDFARGGVRRMQVLIDDLLLYSRVGTEGRALEQVSSREAVEEAMQALSAAVEESEGRVELGDLPVVLADRSQLVQLFQNLISNAIKFRADAPPRIDVSATREGYDWLFAVADNGIGIEARYAEHVFTIFQRLHAGEKYPGTGIGLAVCRRIVERHGGRIWVEAAPGGGSVFRFTIPARRF